MLAFLLAGGLRGRMQPGRRVWEGGVVLYVEYSTVRMYVCDVGVGCAGEGKGGHGPVSGVMDTPAWGRRVCVRARECRWMYGQGEGCLGQKGWARTHVRGWEGVSGELKLRTG